MDLGIPYLTLFAFSTENWNRPRDEVDGLMNLLVDFARREGDRLAREGARVVPIGDLDGLPPQVRREVDRMARLTADCDKICVLIALNYGGRMELARAAREVAKEVLEGALRLDQIDQATFEKRLYTAGYPDPDLIIRTGGEFRLSNFLLFQAAYSEFYSHSKMWPDFDREDLLQAISDYQRRDRRFGGVPRGHGKE